MATYLKKIPYKQDLPPLGGYARINFAQNLPSRGIAGVTLIACGVGVSMFGFYFVIKGNQERRQLGKEKKIGRLSIYPVLLAESDRNVLRALKENFESEKLIMKDVEGWVPGESVYHKKRWIQPISAQLEKL